MEKPLSDIKSKGKIKQHDGKDWGYKCNEEPMCSHCDKKLCKSRKFGIGGEIYCFLILTDLQVVELRGTLLLH